MAVVLKSAKSKLLVPWPRREGSRRLSLPNVKAGGETKHEVLNHRLSFDCAEPETELSQPGTTFGRELPPKELVRLVFVLSPNGKPLWNVETPLMPQPEISLSATPLTLPKNRFPFPAGRSRT